MRVVPSPGSVFSPPFQALPLLLRPLSVTRAGAEVMALCDRASGFVLSTSRGHLHPPAAALGEFVHLGTDEAHLSKHTLELEQQQLRFSSPASCFIGLAEPCMK